MALLGRCLSDVSRFAAVQGPWLGRCLAVGPGPLGLCEQLQHELEAVAQQLQQQLPEADKAYLRRKELKLLHQKTSLLRLQEQDNEKELLRLRQQAPGGGAADDYTQTWLKQNVRPFGPEALWESPALLRQRLAEVIRLPVPDAYATALIQSHGAELRDRLMPVGNLPEGSRALALSMQVLGALALKLGEGSEAYTACATHVTMESMLLFISSYLRTFTVHTARNGTDASGATDAKLRPDFLCWVHNVLLFKGEEKADRDQMDDAVVELTSKMSDTWLEGLGPNSEQPPSMLAYAAAGNHLRFFSVRKRDGAVSAEPISDIIDLGTIPGRFEALTAACNIWRLLAGFSDTGMTAAFALGTTLKTADDRYVTLMPGYVRKRILNFEKEHAPYTSFKLLQDLYQAMSEFSDPCVIIQARGRDGPTGPRLEGNTYQVDVAPVGVPCHGPPATEAAVARAVHGVLRGLAALHSKGFVHRDVRWANVVRLPAERRWLLIDLEHAGVEGCDCSQPPFPLRYWSDRTLDSGRFYTAASDLRMVAEELMGGALGPQGCALRRQLMEGTLTAAAACEHEWFAELALAQR